MTHQEIQSGTEVAQSGTERIGRLGKSHQDFWKRRLRKRSYDWGGKKVEVPDWQIRIAHLGRREWFNLETPNKAAAAVKARDIYISLVAVGWETTLAKYKPEMVLDGAVATVGEFLDQVKASSELRLVTFEIYAKKFRTLVAGVFGIDGGKAKFDYINGGRKKWLDRINRVRLNRITAKRVETWKVRYLKNAEQSDPLSYKRAKTTLNSIIRGSKSLFSRKVLRNLAAKLPSPLPLEGVRNVKVERSRYKSTFSVQAVLAAARNELAERQGPEATSDRECFKILLLALGAGLRRREIDTLTWPQIDWRRNVIRVETTIHARTKSPDSENDVDVDPGLLSILKAYMPQSQSEFVINSPVRPRVHAASYCHYRAERHFNRLIRWLRSKGVNTGNPLHTLRKEFGSQIAAQAGIFAASLALRHSDIQQTRDYYLDKKQTTFFEIGKLLQSDEKPVETGTS